MLSLSRIFKKVVPRLFHPYSFQIRMNKMLREQVVNGDTQILGGGHLGREALIKVQIGVVKAIDHIFLYATIQVGQVANHAGNRIYLPTNRHLYHVVMPMPVGIAALAIHHPIFLLAEGLGV
ncbi:MAG TPA: hypothetical protein VMB49_20100 [Acidobacteriaceae bacterium]|nr:hypothetical protein [Acidobacteriaceae bacterium]